MPRMGALVGWFAMVLMLVGLPAGATVVVPTDKPTIAEGLAWAVDQNDRHVLVLRGDYYQNGPLFVPENVILEGSGAGLTRIIGNPGQTILELAGFNEVAHLTLEGGLDGVAWHESSLSTFSVHDVWFVDQLGAPLLMPGGGWIELHFERNVIVRPNWPAEVLVDGDSEIWIRNNHFVGTATENYLSLTYDSNGLYGGALELLNNIFENGSDALYVNADTSQPIVLSVANNTFNDNLTGFTLECAGSDSVLVAVQNNWFHNNWQGADFNACSTYNQASGWLDYNGWGLNTNDMTNATWGDHALFDTPTYVGVISDDMHPDDDYDLLAGTVGINEGMDVLAYDDADDGSRNDIGSYGGPYNDNDNWNWDGDAWPLGDDCDDRNADTYPGAGEICDGLDNNCDGVVPPDEWDNDSDGVFPCSGDCDDNNPFTYPGVAEECDGVDNDCDGQVPFSETQDNDGDGFLQCGDCEDQIPTVYPGAVEACDGFDTDCDGSMPSDETDADGDGAFPCDGDCDDTRPDLHHWDEDGDGVSSCDGDCNDHDANIYPFNTETCDDNIDNDCDALIDEDDPDCGTADDDDVADDDDDAADDDDDVADDDDDVADDDDDVADDDSQDDDDDAGEDTDIPGGFHCVCSSADERSTGGSVFVLGLALLGLVRRRLG